MSYLHSMLECNKELAAEQAFAETLPPSLPHMKALLVGCADMRIDPAVLLGLKSGDAVVMRDIGGRATPGLLGEMGLLGRIGEVTGVAPGGEGEFYLIVPHHTDCGMTRLANDSALLAHYF